MRSSCLDDMLGSEVPSGVEQVRLFRRTVPLVHVSTPHHPWFLSHTRRRITGEGPEPVDEPLRAGDAAGASPAVDHHPIPVLVVNPCTFRLGG